MGVRSSPGWQMSSCVPGPEAADDLQHAHLVEPPRFDVAPALGAVPPRAELAARQPAEAGQHARLDAAPRVGHPRQRRRLDGAADGADAVFSRHRLHRSPHHGKEPEVMVCVQVIDRDPGGAHARDLGVEFAFDVARIDLPLRPGGDELGAAPEEPAGLRQQRRDAWPDPRPGRLRPAPGARRPPGSAPPPAPPAPARGRRSFRAATCWSRSRRGARAGCRAISPATCRSHRRSRPGEFRPSNVAAVQCAAHHAPDRPRIDPLRR